MNHPNFSPRDITKPPCNIPTLKNSPCGKCLRHSLLAGNVLLLVKGLKVIYVQILTAAPESIKMF